MKEIRMNSSDDASKTGLVQTQIGKPQVPLLGSGGKTTLRQLLRMTPATVQIGWEAVMEAAPGNLALQRSSLRDCHGPAASSLGGRLMSPCPPTLLPIELLSAPFLPHRADGDMFKAEKVTPQRPGRGL